MDIARDVTQLRVIWCKSLIARQSSSKCLTDLSGLETKNRIKELSQDFEKQRVRTLRGLEMALSDRLLDLERQLTSNPTDESVAQPWAQTSAALDKVLAEKASRLLLVTRLENVFEGERPSPSVHAHAHQSSPIEALLDSSGVLHSTHGGISRVIANFWQEILTPAQDSSQTAASKSLLANIRPASALTYDKMDQSTRQISAAALHAALAKSAKKKAPEPDGLPYEFYKAFPHIVDALAEIVTIGPSESMREAHVRLLFKKGDTRDPRNYRPISLLNADYKLYTKALTNALQEVAQEVIAPEQTGFVKGRRLFDNVVLTSFLTEWARQFDGTTTELEGEPALVHMDQEKAYDTVRWTWLLDCLSAYGCPPSFLDRVKDLYQGTTSCFLVNGTVSASIAPKCGLRQGDSLSTLLYVFSIQPFLTQVSADIGIAVPFSLRPTWDPLPLVSPHQARFSTDIGAESPKLIPPILKFQYVAYADDVTALLCTEQQRVRWRFWTKEYEAASNARVKKDKTTAAPLVSSTVDYSDGF